MAEVEAKFSKRGGQLEVEVVVGQRNGGRFIIVLFDEHGHNLQQIRGRVDTDEPTNFLLNSSPTILDNALLMWNIRIQSSNNKPNQLWSVTLIIRQDDEPIEGGVITDRGTFQTVIEKDYEVRLKAK